MGWATPYIAKLKDGETLGYDSRWIDLTKHKSKIDVECEKDLPQWLFQKKRIRR